MMVTIINFAMASSARCRRGFLTGAYYRRVMA
jgi:hypothetical protein